MSMAGLVASLARRWSGIYTAGLPPEIRERRREELMSDLWEHQHDQPEAMSVTRAAARLAARVAFGMPADLIWRVGEQRPRRRLDPMNIAVDHIWDRRMRTIGRATVAGLAAWFIPVAIGLPVLMAVTVPVGAGVVMALHRRERLTEPTLPATVSSRRRTRLIVVGASVGVFALGAFIDSIPSGAFHDRYWMFFVAPMMLAVVVGAIALPMLAWSCVPRRDRHEDPATL